MLVPSCYGREVSKVDFNTASLGLCLFGSLLACSSDGGANQETEGATTEGTTGESSGPATTEPSGGSDGTTTDGAEDTVTGTDADTEDDAGGDTDSPDVACPDIVVSDYYPDVTAGACTSEAGLAIASTMLNLEGITIDNDGEAMTPCMRIECDDDYAYVVSNNIAHYDFVVLTPNPLTESPGVYRIPLEPSAPAGTDATDVGTFTGCEDTYLSYVAGDGPGDEPGGYCGDGYIAATEGTYAQMPCLSEFAVLSNGVVANGPNEGDVGVWGDPGLEPVNELAPPPGASLDYCGAHTGMSMHYHSVNEACFEANDANEPTFSYAEVGTRWDALGFITDECTEPSGIVGWSFDGYPIKGPCICVDRADDGSCSSVKRARTSWVYRGLSDHRPEDAEVDESLRVEGLACTDTEECCADTPDGEFCDFGCNNVVVDGENAGSDVQQICTNVRYAWCTRGYEEGLADEDVSGEEFVYLDRCNGYDSPDGFAYHAISLFPYIQSCYRGEPAEQSAGGGGGGGGDGGGGEATPCEDGQRSGCCGDDVCDGPETVDNCAEDCE